MLLTYHINLIYFCSNLLNLSAMTQWDSDPWEILDKFSRAQSSLLTLIAGQGTATKHLVTLICLNFARWSGTKYSDNILLGFVLTAPYCSPPLHAPHCALLACHGLSGSRTPAPLAPITAKWHNRILASVLPVTRVMWFTFPVPGRRALISAIALMCRVIWAHCRNKLVHPATGTGAYGVLNDPLIRHIVQNRISMN